MYRSKCRLSIPLVVAAIAVATAPMAFAQEKCVRVVGYEWSAKNTVDPAKINNMADSMYAAAIYEPLIWLDTSFEPQPYLAESWEPSADAKVWTFRLREGVKFHDGSTFDAADVVYTYNRLLDPKTASPAAAELDFLSDAKITAVDPVTVRFELTAPDTELPSRLASKFALIVADNATGQQLAAQSNGTGPFKLEHFVPEAPHAVLNANADYWQQGKPKAPCLELSAITEPVSRAAAMLSGQADVLLVADPTTIDQLRSSGNVDLTEAKGSTFVVFAMQTDQPPFDNVKVRQALKAVVDRDAMVELALFGMGTPGNDNPVPPTSPQAYVDKAPAPDIERAKQLLAEAGHGNGLKVELNTGATELYPGMLTMVQAYKEMAAAAGIDVQIVTSPSDSYWDEVWLKRPFFTSYWSPRPSGSAFASGYTCAAKYNETHWCRPEFDALLKNASETIDEAKRVELYKQAQKTLAEEGGVIVPAFSSLTAATRKGCSGYAPHVDVNRMQFADLTCQ
jgi:peptide/nickel transport system substrate-binding protein